MIEKGGVLILKQTLLCLQVATATVKEVRNVLLPLLELALRVFITQFETLHIVLGCHIFLLVGRGIEPIGLHCVIEVLLSIKMVKFCRKL